MAAALAALLSACAATMGAGEAGCASYAEARLARPPAETVDDVPPDWATWIADLDDRMTGTCR
jgi:protein involved in temperature-dependent protein secretion